MSEMMIRGLMTGQYVGMYEDSKYDYIDIESRFGVTGVKMMFEEDTDLPTIDKYLHDKCPDSEKPLVCLAIPTAELYRVIGERNAS